MSIDLYNIRKEYIKRDLTLDTCSKHPLDQLSNWLDEAISSNIIDFNAMVISTIGGGRPSSRVVLLKSVSEGSLIFFTNYNSRKGRDLEVNPYISCNIFWSDLERQIRIEGIVEKLSCKDSDEYFASRPYLSKIGVWASRQSFILEDRSILDNSIVRFCDKFRDEVPRPDFWGGYKVIPDYFEFWQGRANRLHDRIVYNLDGDNWVISRLYP